MEFINEAVLIFDIVSIFPCVSYDLVVGGWGGRGVGVDFWPVCSIPGIGIGFWLVLYVPGLDIFTGASL